MPGSVHWLAPLSMLAALLASILFALGHHLFYWNLHGTNVPQSDLTFTMTGFSATISRQQLTLAIGTTFAFATKSCLVIAVSTAWVQYFWKTLARRYSKKPLTLENVNTAYSVIHNAFILASLTGWRKFSPLFTLALLAWLLPISAIVTPATLVTQILPVVPPPIETLPLSGIRFDILSYLESMNPMNPGFNVYLYRGPSAAVKRIAAAVSAQGTVLTLDSPAANASWTSHFRGPVLRCEELPTAEQLSIQENIATWLQVGGSSHCTDTRFYQTWYGKFPYGTPGSKFGSTFNTPLNTSNMVASTTQPYNLVGRDAAFRLAVFPQMSKYSNVQGETRLPLACNHEELLNKDPLRPLHDLAVNSTVIECKLFKATYVTDFNYIEGSQSVHISVPITGEDEPSPFVFTSIGPSNASCAGINRSDRAEPLASLSLCEFNKTFIEELSYLAIMDSVLELLEGSVTQTGFWYNLSSRVFDTVLMDTYELEFLSDDTKRQQNVSLQTAFRDHGGVNYLGLVNSSDHGRGRQSLVHAIEQMLQNVTVSLMSLPQFRTSSPILTKVTKISYQNIYVYTRHKLWLANGIAIACASTAVAIGLYTILSTGTSYSSDFSTIIRVARGSTLSEEVDPSDTDGKDPLPDYLKRSSISVSGGNQAFPTEEEESRHLRDVAEVRETMIHRVTS